MTLLTLASKQIWPQVLAVLHTKPDRLVLFHSKEQRESLHPAERLRSFFQAGGIPGPPAVLQEWHRILREQPLPEILELLRGDSEHAQRLRQSSPFCGILSSEERMAVFRQYETART